MKFYLEDGIPPEEREAVYAAAARRDAIVEKLEFAGFVIGLTLLVVGLTVLTVLVTLQILR